MANENAGNLIRGSQSYWEKVDARLDRELATSRVRKGMVSAKYGETQPTMAAPPTTTR